MKKEKNTERVFLKNLHDKYYAKKKREINIKNEEKKQKWFFDSIIDDF